MEVTVRRQPATAGAILGECYVDGVFEAFSLERASVAIPAGRYPLLFTVSARAARRELWSPDPQHRLPLVDGVAGRSGIRVHAANEYDELQGCIALGQAKAGSMLKRSRAAVTPFIAKVAAAAARREAMFITIEAPTRGALRA